MPRQELLRVLVEVTPPDSTDAGTPPRLLGSLRVNVSLREWVRPQSERRSISPVIVNNSLARIDASELGRRLASRPSRGGHSLACALLERLGEGGHGLLKALCPALPLTQVQTGAVAGVVVLITAAVGYTWSGIFGLIAGVVLGTVLVGVLRGLLALLINIRDLLAESLTKRG